MFQVLKRSVEIDLLHILGELNSDGLWSVRLERGAVSDGCDLKVHVRVAERTVQVVDYVGLRFPGDEVEVVQQYTSAGASPFLRCLYNGILVIAEMAFKCYYRFCALETGPFWSLPPEWSRRFLGICDWSCTHCRSQVVGGPALASLGHVSFDCNVQGIA